MIKVLDHGYVQLVESGCWGSDEGIIEAARMSTNKGFQGWGPCLICKKCGVPRDSEVLTEHGCDNVGGNKQHDFSGDEKLLRYLYTHKHMTPFEMAGLTVEVQAPIMVFREWHRHRTQSFNEMSGRYTELPDLYYIPSINRLMGGLQSKSNKQSSMDGIDEDGARLFQQRFRETTQDARDEYEYLLDCGVARELARLVLPVNQYSRMRASANLRNWLGFLALRMDTAAQWEIRQFANAVSIYVAERFPRTYQLFAEANGVQPVDYMRNPV